MTKIQNSKRLRFGVCDLVFGRQGHNRGQIMLLSLMILTGTFAIGLGVAVLLLNEIRLSRQSLDSTKAIYAADLGLECELYKYYRNPEFSCSGIQLLNNTSFTSRTVGGAATTSQAIGISRGIRRGLELVLP